MHLSGVMGNAAHFTVQPFGRQGRHAFQSGCQVPQFHLATSSILPPVSSGGACRYARLCSATARNAGAATLPPPTTPSGLSIITRITSIGADAGTNPTKELTYSSFEYNPVRWSIFWAVPVLPAAV